jgi:hypothetical protein
MPLCRATKGPIRPAGEKAVSFLVELWAFMRQEKKFWLLPIVFLMLLFGGLAIVTKGSAVAPFIYAIF